MESNRKNHDAGHVANAADLWVQSAARCGYAIHNNAPVIGVSGDTGDGFLVALPVPGDWFAHVTDEGQRDNLFRAIAGHALRVGQAKVKASKTPTRDEAIAGVDGAVLGTYKPGKDRSNDILDSEAARAFAAHVRARVLAMKADATEDMVAATIAKQAETDKGKVLLGELRTQIAERGTYTPNRKGKGSKADAVAVELD